MIKETIDRLEALEAELLAGHIAVIEMVAEQIPKDILLEKMKRLAEEQIKKNEVHINLHRSRYQAIKNFKDKKTYYEEILQMRELGYTTITNKLKQFLINPQMKQYEAWVTTNALEDIKRKGIDLYILDEMLFGNLL